MGFLWSISDDVSEIGGSAAFGDVGMADEADGVGTGGLFVAVGKATSLFGTGFFPKGTVTATEEFGILDVASRIGVYSFEGRTGNRVDKFEVGLVKGKNTGKEGKVG